MDYYKEIETDRVYLRQVRKEDIPIWTTFFKDNPNLAFLGLDLKLTDEAKARRWFGFQFSRYERNDFGHMAIIDKKTNEFIGLAGLLSRVIDDQNELEVAYSLLPKHWRKGYASEVAIRLRDYAFEKLKKESVISIIHVDNIGSQKVALNNGMKRGKPNSYMDMPVYIYRIRSEDYLKR